MCVTFKQRSRSRHCRTDRKYNYIDRHFFFFLLCAVWFLRHRTFWIAADNVGVTFKHLEHTGFDKKKKRRDLYYKIITSSRFAGIQVNVLNEELSPHGK